MKNTIRFERQTPLDASFSLIRRTTASTPNFRNVFGRRFMTQASSKLTDCSLQSTAGSPKASTRSI